MRFPVDVYCGQSLFKPGHEIINKTEHTGLAAGHLKNGKHHRAQLEAGKVTAKGEDGRPQDPTGLADHRW